MSKKLNLTCFLLLAYTTIFSQDFKMNEMQARAYSVRFPEQKTNPLNRTFSITFKNPPNANFNIVDDVLVNGFKKVDIGNIQIYVYVPNAVNTGYLETIIRKDPLDNKEYFRIQMQTSATCYYSIKSDEPKYNEKVTLEYKKNYSTQERATLAEANNDANIAKESWNLDVIASLKQFLKDKTTSFTNAIFGFPVVFKAFNIQYLKSKTNPELDDSTGIWAHNVKNNFASLKYDTILPSDIKRFEGALNYYDYLLKKYVDATKPHKKIRYLALYNTMKIYYNLDNFQKAEEVANLLIANDYDAKDGKNLIKDIMNLKASLINVEASSIHFKIQNEDKVIWNANEGEFIKFKYK